MEIMINVHVEALDEGGYLATSEDVQGLVAQGRTVQETLEIAKDVARRLLDAQAERRVATPLKKIEASFDYPLIIGS
jgi:predicted RNase H-like HicB family nuclease